MDIKIVLPYTRIGKINIADFQKHILHTYGDNDFNRPMKYNLMWFLSEVDELTHEIRKYEDGNCDFANLNKEFADVFVWLCSLANVTGYSLENALEIYKDACPQCDNKPCKCE